MNFATDGDCYVGWAEAVVRVGSRRRWSAATTPAPSSSAPRASGGSRTSTGLGPLLAQYGEHVALLDLLPVGAPRRDWRSTVTGDGMIVVRHPELQQVIEMTERFATELNLYAS